MIEDNEKYMTHIQGPHDELKIRMTYDELWVCIEQIKKSDSFC